jgi:formate dehydrogenase alpha subunit
VAGLAASFGSGAMTNSIQEMEQCQVALVIGSNTTENHPVIGTVLRRAVLLGGAKIIVADPRRIGLVEDAAIWMRQRPGTDLALINALIHVILKEGLQDQAFIDARTENIEALKESVKKYTPAKAEKITGIPAGDIEAAARLYAGAERAGIFYAMGITQHVTGTDNVKALANLAMVCGHLGKPGSGVNPLRGQNNVQGACDMGGLPGDLPGYQKVANKDVLKRFKESWDLKKLPATPGQTLTEIMESAHKGTIKGLFILGENPMVSDPDTSHVEKALEHLDFLVVQDIFLTETAAMADVVLPGACWAEKDGTFTNTERRVQRVRKAVEAPGAARADWDVLDELGRRLGLDWNYKEPKKIFKEIAEVTPSYGGITYERLESLGSLQWPCPDKKHPGTPILHTQAFTRGKGLFHAVEHQEPVERPDARYPFTLTTGRNLYHYHTRTMTGRSAGLNDLAPKCEVEINPADAAKLGVAQGELVQVSSRRGKIVASACVIDRVAPGVVFLPFHYADAAANMLTIGALDPVAKIPELKVCAVQLKKVA